MSTIQSFANEVLANLHETLEHSSRNYDEARFCQTQQLGQPAHRSSLYLYNSADGFDWADFMEDDAYNSTPFELTHHADSALNQQLLQYLEKELQPWWLLGKGMLLKHSANPTVLNLSDGFSLTQIQVALAALGVSPDIRFSTTQQEATVPSV